VSSGAAAFIDRDGVVNELVNDPVSGRPESPLQVDDVALIPGAAAALRRLVAAGWPIVGISNQPSAAKGLISRCRLNAIQDRVLELLATEEVRFDDFRLCLHHPDGVVPELSGVCHCRKPAPGMLLDAAQAGGFDPHASWMVGDSDVDVLAGRAAGCTTVLVEQPGSGHKRLGAMIPDFVSADLGGAVELILGAGRVHLAQ
jgi:D-glycero-D-manno-heptose 1,7-bisphosphate phosphatase